MVTRYAACNRLWVCTPLLLVCCSLGIAGPVTLPGLGGVSVAVKSLKETRWDTVIRQQYDFSCGSAAVATLLTYHYDQPVGEEEVFKAMFKLGNQDKIRSEGFSMLDMKQFLDARGLRADGFRMTLEQFTRIGVPGITLVNTQGYKHFVVVKGIEDDKVLIGDPAVGTTIVTRQDFAALWNGAVLAAREQVETAREHFNNPRDWQIRPKAPLGEAVNRSNLGTFTVTLPGRNEFGQ